jgi:TRAP transporter TAXI family solute receptor
VALTLLVSFAGAAAAAEPQGLEARRERANAGTVGVVSGGVDGTYIRIAADLAAVLDDGDRLRVLPLIGKGSLQNIADIMFLKGVDVGIVQSDALAYARREHLYPGVDKSIQYIVKLYNEEVHVLAARNVSSLEDLAGKKVNVDVTGSGTAMTASLIFDLLKVPFEPVHHDQALALEELKRGDLSAIVYVAGKPARLFRDVAAGNDGLHFVPIPLTPALLDTYLPSEFTHQDYATLVDEGQSVETVAVGAIMAVYAWPQSSPRYAKVARFVDAFLSNFEAFGKPPRHPKWREVNLTAQVPGWTRFAAAENWMKQAAVSGSSTNLARDFDEFLRRANNGRLANASRQEKEAFFQEFLRWEQSRSTAR